MTYKPDPCTDTILAFIRGGVPGNMMGEAGGNYNAYFGHVRSKIDMSKKTIAQIYIFQGNMLKRDPRSTAIGAYQFLRGTLRRLVQMHKIPTSELFTPALQDRLGWELLVGRGYKSWWTGGLSDKDFAHLLSCEWASLPDPYNDGKSHYDGDAVGNHASTTLDEVYKMLETARNIKPGMER
jgi:muramidase (phage lysozyme)